MHLRPTFLLFASIACLGAAIAQEPASEKPKAEKPKAEATPPAKKEPAARPVRPLAKAITPSPTPAAAKKRSLFSRVFGKKETPPATPVTTPTPKPRRPRKPAEPPTATAAAKPDTESPAAKPDASKPPKPDDAAETAPVKPADAKPPVAEPPPVKKGPKGKPTPNPKPKAQTKEQLALEKAMASEDPEAIEKAKYDEVKARAATDSHVVELKQKADNAISDSEGRKDLKTYNKALFQKMRTLEPGIKARIDRMEAAVLKQLDGAE